jgi:DNA-directed RNA polymerase subunit E'
MYYKSKVEGVVRVEPKRFAENLKAVILGELRETYENRIIDELGRVLVINSVDKVGEGMIVAGDGAAFYNVTFEAVHYLPEINELIEGEVKDIAKFGAFIDFGAFEGMIHISQTMDDFVSFSKDGTLLGKDSNKVLKVGDKVRSRIIAISIKNIKDPKIGMTMRQPYLGKLEWIDEIRNGEST